MMRPILALLLVAGRLAAQAPDTAVLNATVITATRIPVSRDAVTAAVSVLDGAALRSEGVTHVGDALRRVPGLAMARTSSFGSQHTLFLRGGQGNYVRVLVDGVPLNEPGGVVDLGRVTLDNVERIEVVRGPASVLYGSEAVTGVIQIFTRTGGGPTRLSSELGGGSFGARRVSLGGRGGSAAARWSLQGDRHATDGVLAFNNAYRNDGIAGSLTFTPDARTELRLTSRFNNSMYRYPTGSSGALEDRDAERTEHRLVAGLELGRRWTDRIESRAQVTAMDLLPKTNDGSDTPADTLGFFGYFARGTVKRRMVDARTTARLGHAQFLTLGAEWARDTERSTSLSLSEYGPFPGSFRAARENAALYAQLHGERGRLAYTLGGRRDENTAFGRFITGRLGTAWRVTDGLRLRASAGSAFKAPSFFENFAQDFTVGNPDLRPEQSRSADLGVEWAPRAGLTLQATAFTQRFRNLIQYKGAEFASGLPNFFNVAAANAGGLELEATVDLPFRVRSTVAHTWTDTRVVDAGFDTAAEANFVQGARLLRRPAHVTSLQLTRVFASRGSLSVAVVRTGARDDRDFSTWPARPVVLDAFTTVDVGTEWRLPSAAGARVVLRAENLLDERYRQIAGFDSPGRVLYAGFRLER